MIKVTPTFLGLALLLSPTLAAQTPDDSGGSPSLAPLLLAPTNWTGMEMLQQELTREKYHSRQAILQPVAPPDLSFLDHKAVSQMSPEELNALVILQPHRLATLLEQAQTPEQKAAQVQKLRTISDPVAHNREREKTKTSTQKKREQAAAYAILHPRIPSAKEFHSQSIARPQ